ncbi:hypothetical protein P8452_61589 [Trifolium repens]|nr:hypothetical protein P8452_61589 [Trifolium repens]
MLDRTLRPVSNPGSSLRQKEIEKASGSTLVKVNHFFSSSNQITFRFKMAHQIKGIRDRLDKVVADGANYNRGGGVTRRLSILKMMLEAVQKAYAA